MTKIRIAGPYEIKPAIPQFIEIPIAYDVLVAATNRTLGGYSIGLRYEINSIPGETTFCLWSDELGNLGTLSIDKLDNTRTLISISDVPRPTIRGFSENEKMELSSLNNSEKNQALIDNWNLRRKETTDLYRKRKTFRYKSLRTYIDRMNQENIWVISNITKPPKERSDAKLRVALAIASIRREKFTTWSGAAKWACTTTGTIGKYENDEWVMKQADYFVKHPDDLSLARNQFALKRKKRKKKK